MARRFIDVPRPSLGRTVIYFGYTPHGTRPERMPATIIAAPANVRWNTPVTLEVIDPVGERQVLHGVRCSPWPERRDASPLGYFTWPASLPLDTVVLEEDGTAVETAADLRAAYGGVVNDRAPTQEEKERAAGFDAPPPSPNTTLRRP